MAVGRVPTGAIIRSADAISSATEILLNAIPLELERDSGGGGAQHAQCMRSA